MQSLLDWYCQLSDCCGSCTVDIETPKGVLQALPRAMDNCRFREDELIRIINNSFMNPVGPSADLMTVTVPMSQMYLAFEPAHKCSLNS